MPQLLPPLRIHLQTNLVTALAECETGLSSQLRLRMDRPRDGRTKAPVRGRLRHHHLLRDRANAVRLLQLNRQHWTIENGVFYVRDETIREDRSRSRTRSGPQVMTALRNAALSLPRLDKARSSQPA